MARDAQPRFARRSTALAAVGLVAPALLGVMLARLGGFYPDSPLSTALPLAGVLVSTLPVAVVVIESRRTSR